VGIAEPCASFGELETGELQVSKSSFGSVVMNANTSWSTFPPVLAF
jgi:hypothetical protein